MKRFTLSSFAVIAGKVGIAQNTLPATGTARNGTTSPTGILHNLSYNWNKILLDVPISFQLKSICLH